MNEKKREFKTSRKFTPISPHIMMNEKKLIVLDSPAHFQNIMEMMRKAGYKVNVYDIKKVENHSMYIPTEDNVSTKAQNLIGSGRFNKK